MFYISNKRSIQQIIFYCVTQTVKWCNCFQHW